MKKTATIAFLFVALMLCGGSAQSVAIDKVRAAIKKKGAKWAAKESPWSRLSLEEKRKITPKRPPKKDVNEK